MDDQTKLPNQPSTLAERKLAEAIKALELIGILGQGSWGKDRARQALADIKAIRK